MLTHYWIFPSTITLEVDRFELRRLAIESINMD